MSDRGVHARGIVKRFRGVVALASLDLDAEPGSIVGLTGTNGAGKTTALRVFATLLRPDDGTATVDGADVIREEARVRRSIGVALVNERAMYWRLSGRDNLRFFARAAGMGRRGSAVRVDEVLEQVGLTAIASRRVAGYSAGQRQRLNLGRAVLAAPSVLLIDEPMRGLDHEGMDMVRAMLRAEAARGACLLIAAPALDGFEDLCDIVYRLRAGTVADVQPRATLVAAGDGS